MEHESRSPEMKGQEVAESGSEPRLSGSRACVLKPLNSALTDSSAARVCSHWAPCLCVTV